MNGNILDTNVIIKLLNGDLKTIEIVDSIENINISVITVGELFYGAKKSSRVNENMRLFQEFLSEYPIIGIDEGISDVYGDIKAGLVKAGINIPENDIWIAATALKHDLTIVSFDAHFKNIVGLKIL
jgi:tRNA(fMet)-specific endonuclease VapC